MASKTSDTNSVNDPCRHGLQLPVFLDNFNIRQGTTKNVTSWQQIA